METLLSISKEERINRRRNRIREKLHIPNTVVSSIENSTKKSLEDEKGNEIITVKNIYEDNIKEDIIEHVKEKHKDYLNELTNEINKENKQSFLENIKRLEIADINLFQIEDQQDVQKTSRSVVEFHRFDSKNDIVEINNLAIKEKETYNKKIEKYFSLLKYKDERIEKMCQIHSTNFSSLINFMRDQMEGYKIYLEGIYNKTRDDLNFKRKQLLNENKKIVEDFLKLQTLKSYEIARETMKDEKMLNDKIKRQHVENNLNLKLKNDLLEKQLQYNIDFVKDVSSIVIDKEKNIYETKILMQKDNYNLKMINFYKIEINKLREALLSIKTYYYNYKMKSKKLINELISQYERIKFQFIALQKRQKSYEHNFQNKYAAAWELQKNEANKYMEKLVAASKIIHEQIFLTEFKDFDYEILIKQNSSSSIDNGSEDENNINPVPLKKVTETEIETVKKLILQECAFLLDDNEKKNTDEEKIKHIFKYIGVYNQKNLELLTQLFYIEKEEALKNTDQEDEKGEEQERTNVKEGNQEQCKDEEITNNSKFKKINRKCIAAEYTLDIISKYCKEKEKESLCKITKRKQKYTNRLNTSLKLTIERRKKEKEYWDNLSHVISEEMIDLWKSFLVFVEKYFNILKERKNVIDDIYKEEKQAKEYLKIINQMNYLEK